MSKFTDSVKSTKKDAVRVTWMGTAGLYVTDGETDFFIDPFVSRYGLLKVLSGFLLPPKTHIIQEWLNRMGCHHADAVIVSHSHYDHALDAPFFAQKTGALLIGSDSTAWIGQGAGLAKNQIKIVRPGDRVSLGKFEIIFIKSQHSKALFGRVPWPGDITAPLIPPAAASDYRLGDIFSLLVTHPTGSFVHLGSAGYIEGMFDNLSAHTIFLCIAGRGDTRELLGSTALAVKAKQIIPIHFDNFFSPLNDEMSVLWGARLSEFYKTAALVAPDIFIQPASLGRQFVLYP
jgi:L-ascorbate metabolism protein UlaG (beta-lactamase superfamily)